MDYVQPYGEGDPNASYKDRDSAAGEPGSRVPALAIEMPQREIKTVLLAAGLVPDRTDPTQLNEAIDAKIALATGGGENPLNDLLDLLRARLLFYPEILTSDGQFNLVVPSTGTVRVPAGIVILHRGVFPITTAQQDFTTVANKTYHLRYRFTGTPGWSLVDVSDSVYNPSALAETATGFDTGYDDMISHKVVTSPSNVATITPLVNRHRLMDYRDVTLSYGSTPANAMTAAFAASFNWARTPKIPLITWTYRSQVAPISDNDEQFTRTVSRYAIAGTAMLDYADVAGTNLQVSAWA